MRRKEDLGNSLWTVFNKVQENTMRGFSGIKTTAGIRKIKSVTGIETDIALNKQIWTLAEQYLN